METEELLEERGTTHGHFIDNAGIGQHLKLFIRTQVGWCDLTDIQKESLEYICQKISRVLSGNPNHKDHWDDIAGYAKLVSNYLELLEK